MMAILEDRGIWEVKLDLDIFALRELYFATILLEFAG
jgi:hypothetical protein